MNQIQFKNKNLQTKPKRRQIIYDLNNNNNKLQMKQIPKKQKLKLISALPTTEINRKRKCENDQTQTSKRQKLINKHYNNSYNYSVNIFQQNFEIMLIKLKNDLRQSLEEISTDLTKECLPIKMENPDELTKFDYFPLLNPSDLMKNYQICKQEINANFATIMKYHEMAPNVNNRIKRDKMNPNESIRARKILESINNYLTERTFQRMYKTLPMYRVSIDENWEKEICQLKRQMNRRRYINDYNRILRVVTSEFPAHRLQSERIMRNSIQNSCAIRLQNQKYTVITPESSCISFTCDEKNISQNSQSCCNDIVSELQIPLSDHESNRSRSSEILQLSVSSNPRMYTNSLFDQKYERPQSNIESNADVLLSIKREILNIRSLVQSNYPIFKIPQPVIDSC